ncbi:hypothetical protein MBAV_005828 [Candidatus Magnetobacterium bavaricum]|uniref:Uncharacterized protein n=1 Tax=Candidatus Magnetobacterium bavaricum TaxID=29290 RepID=A0A0F3GJ41_9BACT|nr:hypothetical protein MBAV_005828 [Candidatus Magnetobacterium bavaricum]
MLNLQLRLYTVKLDFSKSDMASPGLGVHINSSIKIDPTCLAPFLLSLSLSLSLSYNTPLNSSLCTNLNTVSAVMPFRVTSKQGWVLFYLGLFVFS